MESVINDVELLDLAVIPTDGGPVMHMMRPASPLFGEIGEVYFSEVEPGCVKAWKCHTRQTQRFAVPSKKPETSRFKRCSSISDK